MPAVSAKSPGRIARMLPVVLGVIGLGAGLWMSLSRLGLPVDGLPAINHGPIMVGGFIGTVIALERAVALGRPWGYAAPWFGAISTPLLLVPLPHTLPATALLLSSLVLLIMFGVFLRNQPTDFMLIMTAGALCWSVANALLLIGRSIPDIVPWWAGFLILTIVGERVEMSRLRTRPRAAQGAMGVLVVAYGATLVAGTFAADLGTRLGGLVLVGLTMWLVRYDVARLTVRMHGLPRFAAFTVLSGYVWLLVSGVFAALWGKLTAGFYYDAWMHAQFLGFVMGMIMAHAPIILPAVTGVPLQFSRLFYFPVVLLHLSLATRIGADLMHSWSGRQWTGVVNIVAVLFFMAVIAHSVKLARSKHHDQGQS